MSTQTKSLATPSLELPLKYALVAHEYIKAMNKATDDRANYLIVGNSVIFASLGSVSKADLPGHWALSLIPTIICLSISIACSIIAILPKTWDPDIPIHTAGIARLKDKYHSHVRDITEEGFLTSVCRENAVVSRIVERKGRLVTLAGCFFLAALASGMVTLLTKALVSKPHP